MGTSEPQIRPEQVSASIARAMACKGCGCALNCAAGADLYRLRCAACVAREAAQPEIRAERVTTLVLPPALSANKYWRPVKIGKHITIVPTSEAKAYRHEVAMLARKAGVTLTRGRVALTVRMYPARPQDWAKRAAKDPDGWDDTVRSIDLDNALKVLLDALKNVAFEDDSWVRRIDAERCEPDERGARVVVTISPLQREAIAPGLF